jgi:2-polyprenyl-6-methoxyphenol hydroxylase-like FAD-dependent oxidoreductase
MKAIIIGAGIWLGGNAMRVYERLGLANMLKDRSYFLHTIYIKDYKGNILQQVDNNAIKAKYGNGTHAIHRATLQYSLAEALDYPIHTGRKCVAILEEGSGVTAIFEDGSRAQGDLLIGADGIRSIVREQCIAKADYRYSGQTCWRAIVPMELPPGRTT